MQALHKQGMALGEACERVQRLTCDMHKILGECPFFSHACTSLHVMDA